MTLKRNSKLKSKKSLTSRKYLRSYTKLNSNKPLSVGKKTTEWDEARKYLKENFKKNLKITECEAKLDGCWVNNGLTFAHAKKRRYLQDHELTTVILCCIQCHTCIEEYPSLKMQEFVENIINNRKVKNL